MDNNDELALAGVSLPGVRAVYLQPAGRAIWRVVDFELEDDRHQLPQKNAALTAEIVAEIVITTARIAELQRARLPIPLEGLTEATEAIRRIGVVARALEAEIKKQRAAHNATVAAVGVVRRRMLARIALAESYDRTDLADEPAGRAIWRVVDFELEDSDRQLPQKITTARIGELLDEAELQRARLRIPLEGLAEATEAIRRIGVVARALEAKIKKQRAARNATVAAIGVVRRRMLARIALAESYDRTGLADDYRAMLASLERFATAAAPVRLEAPWRTCALYLSLIVRSALSAAHGRVVGLTPKKRPVRLLQLLLKEIGFGGHKPSTIADAVLSAHVPNYRDRAYPLPDAVADQLVATGDASPFRDCWRKKNGNRGGYDPRFQM